MRIFYVLLSYKSRCLFKGYRICCQDFLWQTHCVCLWTQIWIWFWNRWAADSKQIFYFICNTHSLSLASHNIVVSCSNGSMVIGLPLQSSDLAMGEFRALLDHNMLQAVGQVTATKMLKVMIGVRFISWNELNSFMHLYGEPFSVTAHDLLCSVLIVNAVPQLGLSVCVAITTLVCIIYIDQYIGMYRQDRP